MVELIRDLEVSRVRGNLERVREQIAATAEASASNRGQRGEVQVLAVVKYVPNEELGVLQEAGIRLVGENRAQDLQEKALAHPGLFEWHFIGQLQSRRVKAIVPHARLIHSVASESAMRELERHREQAMPGMQILLEVNVAGEQGKAGIAPDQIDRYIETSAFPVVGLMTMPPLASDPEHNRRWFAALRELADQRKLPQLSMGTSQDHLVAVQEGATIVRIGTRLYD
jgi:pyridoxal phosphate enzyme (YggS family)